MFCELYKECIGASNKVPVAGRTKYVRGEINVVQW